VQPPSKLLLGKELMDPSPCIFSPWPSGWNDKASMVESYLNIKFEFLKPNFIFRTFFFEKGYQFTNN
jgi:hypothetical protein